MKRGEEREKDVKGYMISLSDVYEVEFKQTTNFHTKGDKILVSLPIAIKFINEGKVDMTAEILEAVKANGMDELINELPKGKRK